MSFLGTTATLEYFAPNLQSPIIFAQTAVVGDQEEFPDMAQWDIPGDLWLTTNGDIDIDANTITYVIDETFFTQFASVPEFNGLVLTFDLGDTRISGIEVVRDDLALPTENIYFNDNSIFVDVDGIAFSNGDTGVLDVSFMDSSDNTIDFDDAIFTARLYSAAFGREPDQAGLNFWINAYDDVGRLGMSNYFLESPEFQDRFGDPVTLSDDGYLDVLYNNILGRNGDELGTAYWLDVLARDVADRAEVLSYFVDSDENVSNTQSFENLGVSADNGEWFLLV